MNEPYDFEPGGLMRDVLGFIGGGLILVSSAAHSLLGWPAIGLELAKTNAPADLVTGIAAGWYFGGAAMLIIGVTVVVQFVEVRRNPSASLRATQVAGLIYLAFGFGALAITREPFATLFIVPGLVLAGASWGRR